MGCLEYMETSSAYRDFGSLGCSHRRCWRRARSAIALARGGVEKQTMSWSELSDVPTSARRITRQLGSPIGRY